MIFLRLGIKSYTIYIFSIILAAISAVNTNAAEQLPSALKVTGTWLFELNGHKAELSAWTVPAPFHFNRAKLQGVLLIDGGKCQMAVNIIRTSYSSDTFFDHIKDPENVKQIEALGKISYDFEKIINYNYYNVSCVNYLPRNSRFSLFVSPDDSLKIAHLPYAEDEITLYLESLSDLKRSSASSLMREIVSTETEEHKSFLSKIYKTDPTLKIEISPSEIISYPTNDVAEVLFEKSVHQSSINNFSPQYVLNDYKSTTLKRGWWKIKSRKQPNNGYAYEIISLDPKLNLNPESGIFPEISGINWPSIDPEVLSIYEVLDEADVKKRIQAINAFLNWYDSPEKGKSTTADIAPIINNISNWYLVSNFGVQYIERRRSSVLRGAILHKEIDMSDTFEFGEPTGHMTWDGNRQYLRALPTAKNTVTGVIEDAGAEPYHEIYFLYDAAKSEQLGTPAYTSSKILFTRDELCLEWAGDINIATCTKTVSATPMKNRVFTLIKDKDIATTYYYNLIGKPQNTQNAMNNRDKCADGPFCDQLGDEYLQNIFKGNYSAVRREDLKTRDQYREALLRGQLRENPIFNQWVDALVPYSVSNLKLVLDRYLLAYKKFPDRCFVGGRQTISIAAQTDKITMVNGLGVPTGETFGGEIISSVYEVPPHLVPYVNKLGRASSEGSKATLGLINKFVTGADTSNIAEPLETLPEKVDCRSEELATFERNLISFYERVSNEPATQPPGAFVRSYE